MFEARQRARLKDVLAAIHRCDDEDVRVRVRLLHAESEQAVNARLGLVFGRLVAVRDEMDRRAGAARQLDRAV